MTEAQQARLDSLAELSAQHGESFATTATPAVAFVAWPVATPAAIETDLDATLRAGFFFETTSTVVLVLNAVVTRGGKRHTITSVMPRNPITGVIRFAIGEGRA